LGNCRSRGYRVKKQKRRTGGVGGAGECLGIVKRVQKVAGPAYRKA